ncbi:Na+/H+ antiporter family protein [Bacillus luteolus]|uniref:Na+/H+ antiporter family protein n=1 Tax=Litchfieldia luteola TaxID=682179 RepID=A0ABR9QG17_9BACI|nr:Na+/H+ antiporter family protein [Cytobacillus luteolus]MBE4907434.1 Na+/H+ antiporter family protein [Cytobacillus luteolus]MBP1944200.1 putative histidine transporter YuiF (NhaC family) [Cytobacillus luteolus]
MNAVLIAVAVMLVLSLLRVNVVFALVTGALIGGLTGGMSLEATISTFSNGLGSSAVVALSYALLGGFAVALSKTGLPDAMVQMALKIVGKNGESKKKSYSKVLVVLIILVISIFSQNVIPIHIAFIPILIPPLLKVLNELRFDRRLIATVITFGLTAPYILLPVGFGKIFHDILQTNMMDSGLEVSVSDIPIAMLIPVLGMLVGLLWAVFFSYRKPRNYQTVEIAGGTENIPVTFSTKSLLFAVISIVVALVVQLQVDSMIFGALAGIVVIYVSGSMKWREADTLLTDGMKMMAFIGFVMLAASGFADVLKETGDVDRLVEQSAAIIGGNQSLAALLMLLVGLLITMGIGSSFSTIPIIATIFVPLSIQLGFSPMATIALVGTAAALGDAGSPASDSTLGPTAGLNADGAHNHIWDTCVPTFLHFNVPLIVFGWIASMVL